MLNYSPHALIVPNLWKDHPLMEDLSPEFLQYILQ